jgi:hypothetical protein
MKKFYFFIDDLDVSGDKIPDGILVRKVEFDFKNKKIIYHKNNYITKENLLSANIYKLKSNKNNNNLNKYLISNMNSFRLHVFDVNKKLIPNIIISANSYFYENKYFNNVNINKFYDYLNNLFL